MTFERKTMGSLSEEEYYFFDASGDIASVSDDARSEDHLSLYSCSSFDHSFSRTIDYDLWANSPISVHERRSKFFSLMGEMTDESGIEELDDRLRECSGAILRHSHGDDHSCSAVSIMEGCSVGSLFSEADFCRGLSSGRVIREGGAVTDDHNGDGGCVPETVETVTRMLSENALSSSLNMSKELEEPTSTPTRVRNWFTRLRSMTCVVDNQLQDRAPGNDDEPLQRVQKVKVSQSGKRTKELSAFYMSQDIQAHSGSILAMKFSPDGHYLASAGMDGVLRIWTVLEDERSNELDIPEIDPSCIYFTVNHSSELKPLVAEKEKTTGLRSLRKTSDSACIIFPPKVFRIIEKPLHEFHGHSADILDISWSADNRLLSASVDKTVRLWKVGIDHCLRVFWHSNYVTCVHFNPVDESYFISGSIDGKVRVWNISSCQVVDWKDVKDIVTAACFRPDGKGAIVGSMEGFCRFYTMSENHLQLDAQICLTSKKKALCKRITGIQFSPEDSSKVIVSCGDSRVRVLQGHEVITKYKSSKSTCNFLSASFTSSGRHIISASEDSNVYIWNHFDRLGISRPQVKTVKSCERFSTDASVAISWCGFTQRSGENGQELNGGSAEALPLFSPASFSIGQEYFLESFPRGSATWPEEKLPTPSPMAAFPSMHSSRFKFLKASCQNTGTSHAWGMVIVTAGYDGRIKSFHNYGLPVAL